jgi:trypsin
VQVHSHDSLLILPHVYHNLFFLRPLGYSKITTKMITLNNIRYIFVAVTSFFLLVRAASSSSLLRGGSDTTENIHQYHRRTIIGGSNAPSGRYSYFASLRRVSDNGATGSHFCGGAVIAPRVILTAAHCAGGRYAKQVRAVIGRSGFDDINDGEEIDVIQEIIHPNVARVDGKAPNYDFALLILKKAVNTNEIKMLQLNSEPDIPVGTPLTVIGNGYTKEGTYSVSNKLKELEMYAISNEVCKQSKGSGWQNFEEMITDQMICAEDSPDDNVEEDKCSGDSGGPLLIKGDDPSGADDVEVGVVSWGYKCAIEGYPGVYARVSEAYEWVQEQLDELYPTPPTKKPTPVPTLVPTVSLFEPTPVPTTLDPITKLPTSTTSASSGQQGTSFPTGASITIQPTPAPTPVPTSSSVEQTPAPIKAALTPPAPTKQPTSKPTPVPTPAPVAVPFGTMFPTVPTTLAPPTKLLSTPASVPPVATMFPTVRRGRSGERERSGDGANRDDTSFPTKTSQVSSSSSITYAVVVGVLLLFLLTLLVGYSIRNR